MFPAIWISALRGWCFLRSISHFHWDWKTKFDIVAKSKFIWKKRNATTWPVELFQRLLWNTAMMQWGCRMLKSFNFSRIMSSPNIQPTTNSNHKSHLGILIHNLFWSTKSSPLARASLWLDPCRSREHQAYQRLQDSVLNWINYFAVIEREWGKYNSICILYSSE